MGEKRPYYAYSDYLKEKYHEKVYKLPVNLPVNCPNRIHGRGCDFCAEQGTGFEAMKNSVPVKEQLERRGNILKKDIMPTSLSLISRITRILIYHLQIFKIIWKKRRLSRTL